MMQAWISELMDILKMEVLKLINTLLLAIAEVSMVVMILLKAIRKSYMHVVESRVFSSHM